MWLKMILATSGYRRLFCFGLTAILLVLTACAPRPAINVKPVAEFDALFDRRQGWTGADGAYTVSLLDDTILWLFGDTWIGNIRDGRHVDAVLVRNTIALQTGKDPTKAQIEFNYSRSEDGRPDAFIRPEGGRGWFWPYHGYLAANGLYLFLIHLEEDTDPNSLGFRVIGNWLTHVGNPRDPPANWRIRFTPIPFNRGSAEGDVIFGSSVMKAGPFLYIYGTKDQLQNGWRNKVMIVVRVEEVRLAEFDRWQFWGIDGWGADSSGLQGLCDHMANEYSVSYFPNQKAYVVIYSPDGFGGTVALRTAPVPEGPWSGPVELYRCPEAGGKDGVFCYAAKGHPGLSESPSQLVVSYVYNSLDFDVIQNRAKLYRPHFLRIYFEP